MSNEQQLKEVIEGNKLIAAFMGIKWQLATHIKLQSIRTYDPVFDTYEECEELMNKENGLLQGSPRVMEYYHVVPVIGSVSRELKYHSSFDWLMPVLRKIEQECGCIVDIFAALTWGCKINHIVSRKEFLADNNGGLPIITGLYNASIEFIKFYNTQSKS